MLPPLFAESAGEANQRLAVIARRVALALGADQWAIQDADPSVRCVRARHTNHAGFDYWNERQWYVTMYTDLAIAMSAVNGVVEDQTLVVTHSLNGAPLHVDDCEFKPEGGRMRLAIWVSGRVKEDGDE